MHRVSLKELQPYGSARENADACTFVISAHFLIPKTKGDGFPSRPLRNPVRALGPCSPRTLLMRLAIGAKGIESKLIWPGGFWSEKNQQSFCPAWFCIWEAR
jgi:hypothetical protein